MRAHSRIVAVTGATGLIGRHLCDHLRRRGWTVRALVRNVAAYPFEEQGIDRFRLDLPEFVDAAALDGVDAVVHAAYATRSGAAAAAKGVNEEGTARLLAAARARGVRRFVFVSSLSAHPRATSYYGRSKLAIEARLDPSRDLVLRPGLVLAADGGLAHRLWRAVTRSPVVPLIGGGGQIVQTIHIDDLCEAFERALDRDITGTINVAETEGIRMKELLTLLAASADARPFLLPVPALPVLWSLRLMEALGIQLDVSSENLRGLLVLRHFDTARDLLRLDLRVRTARESIDVLARSIALTLASS